MTFFCLLYLTFLCQRTGTGPSLLFFIYFLFLDQNAHFPSHVLPFLLRQDQPPGTPIPRPLLLRVLGCFSVVYPRDPPMQGRGHPPPSGEGRGSRGTPVFIPSSFGRGWGESPGGKTRSRLVGRRGLPPLRTVFLLAGWAKANARVRSSIPVSHLTDRRGSNVPVSDAQFEVVHLRHRSG